jgi:DNA-directed RNA polymerase subunit RPC12/RpoP
MDKYTYVCTECGSDNVVSDAWASWNPETMNWELETIHDESYCRDCENNQIETKATN